MLARIGSSLRTALSAIPIAQRVLASENVLIPKAMTRLFTTSSLDLGRTKWSYIRPRIGLPKMKLPQYLYDGSILRGQRRAGRGLDGRHRIRHKGGGHARNYRFIDYVRVPVSEQPMKIKDKVIQIGYDPSRSARIAKVAGDLNNQYRLIIAADGLQAGDIITASRGPPVSLARLNPGDAYPLSTLPVGTMVHCIEEKVGEGAYHARSAGTFGTLMRKVGDQAVVKMNTKTEHSVPIDALASIGRVSNPNHRNEIVGKAGRSRWLGRRPKGQTGKDRWLHKKKCI